MESTRKRNITQQTLNFEKQGPQFKSVDESILHADKDTQIQQLKFDKEDSTLKNVVNKSGYICSKVYGKKLDEINEKIQKASSQNLKLACFDMDWTLIRTKLGNTFPKDKDDWLPLYDKKTAQKLNDLDKDGFIVVIFSNQAGVENGRTKVNDLFHKFEQIQKHMDVPMIFMASTLKECPYRKPKKGLWTVLCDQILKVKQSEIDKNSSFYCGDAAGRKHKPFNDFSNDDLLFSITLGIKFYTPEMLFLNEDINFKQVPGVILDKKFEIKKEEIKIIKKISNSNSEQIYDFYKSLANNNEQDVIIFCGPPGCGKSTFYRLFFSQNYLRINNDTLGSAAKSLKLFGEVLQQKQKPNVIIDNTNYSIENRKKFIEIAINHGVKSIRCIYFDIAKEICMENNSLRKLEQKTSERSMMHMSKNVPSIAIHSFFKNKEIPKQEEGFTQDVIKIKFQKGDVDFDKFSKEEWNDIVEKAKKNTIQKN